MSCLISLLHILHPFSFAALSSLHLSDSYETLMKPQNSYFGHPIWQHTFVSSSAFLRRAVVSYWRKYVHEVLVNRLGSLSLPRKSVVRLTERPDMTLDVYRGRKTTMQILTLGKVCQ